MGIEMKPKLTHNTLLQELLEKYEETFELLYPYGLNKLIENDILEIVAPRLTLEGFFRLFDISEEDRDKLWKEINKIVKKYSAMYEI
ncbi:MAG TPA: hypothetical protein EYH48_04715 [Aquifex aeolicus]|uniref:DUF1858 domain-containing protein n=1 Tax=Aquifex aeolicus TaxID=63363 RepID=A0A9D0YQ76_AQUAO|nr:hypothetical protein [Aquificales bacterium]HIP98548.1 hypothetical protein [Aquifex aeolicus]HIQ26611.1 hypothetical protein [Aquifex aeolicus]